MAKPTESLAAWLAWLYRDTGIKCTCDWEQRHYRGEMPGWVRVTTNPDCQEHGTASRG